MENQCQRRIWKPKKDYKSKTPSKFGKGVFLPKEIKKKFEEMQEAKEEENLRKD